ncbi:MAG: hypothetical protein RIF32_17980 [Leptospirales bacterium]|jgi:putative oxidoreductase
MNIATIVARALVGLIFVVFGLNGFLQFIPLPELPEQAGAFMGILFGSGIGTVVKLLEIIGGGLLLASIVLNRFAPLGLTILTPIVVNIFLFHLLLAPEGMAMPIVLVVLSGFLLYAYKDNFAGIFAEH